MNVTYSQHIDAPIETVFDFVDDDEKLPLWLHGLEETRYPDGRDPANPVGTRFVQKIREGGRVQEYEGEVVAYEKPHHLAILIGNKSFCVRVDYRFREENGGTRLDYSCEPVRATWVVRFLFFAFHWLTMRILRKQMASLKELAEQASAASSRNDPAA